MKQHEIPFNRLDGDTLVPERRRLQALEIGRTRLIAMGALFTLAFLVLGGRMIELTMFGREAMSAIRAATPNFEHVVGRSDIVDRNGVVLATSLPTRSLFVDPTEVLDPEVAALKLSTTLGDLSYEHALAMMMAKGRFHWLYRDLTPQQTYDVNALGIPGLGFRDSERRVYPHGGALAHVLGITNTEGHGLTGAELKFNADLSKGTDPLQLSFDMRIQAILHAELAKAVDTHSAVGGAGVVMDVNTGEVIAMVSLPDFDPNQGSGGSSAFNRATLGVYEMGSTFKLFTAAMALDSGSATVRDSYDARKPIRVGRFTITDYHGKNRWLSVPEILVYSSNIGSAKMALDVGIEGQRDYLSRFGLLTASAIELPEVGRPLTPATWREANAMTISYGHGIAVSPVQLVGGISAVVNGGLRYEPTILKRSRVDDDLVGERVIKPETSDQMRKLMRMVVRQGTGGKADVVGYRVGGKTGTAEKLGGATYKEGKLISSFIAAFPMDDPKYVVLAVLDEPQPTKATFGYATGGWVSAPVVGNVIARLGPLMGILPNLSDEPIQDLKRGKPMTVAQHTPSNGLLRRTSSAAR